jgi:hypothetical protein
MIKNVFDYPDYKDYLSARFATSGPSRGLRSKLAAKLGCQVAHISQVLNGPGHFTLEHAALIDEFLAHDAQESEAFLLLVHLARAGNRTLGAAYKRRFDALLEERRRARIKMAETTIDQEAELGLYYQSWHVAAVHVYLMRAASDLRSVAAALGLTPKSASAALATLVKLGLATEVKGRFAATPRRLHLPYDAPLVAQHHLNWRRRTVLALEAAGTAEDLHYSGPMAISAASAKAIRALLVATIEKMEPLIAAAGEDVTRVVCIDFFPLAAE